MPPRIVEAITHEDGLCRCPWPGTDATYVAYHDEEWGVPEWDDRALFEKLILDGFQAGLSWITILRKREAFRAAFDGFDPEKIARYSERKFAKLMADPGIVRNRAKIEAAPALARAWLDLQGKGGFARHVWSFVDGRADLAAAQDARRHSRRHSRGRGAVEGSQGARRQIRRADHRLRLHAGRRHGQRPSRDLPPPRRLRRARQASPVVKAARARAWQRMLSGRRLDLIDPSPLDVEIADIAHGLARVARWNGQTKGPEIFSVAQHSLLVEAIFCALAPAAPRAEKLAALLHDGPEYVIGDMISPFKAAIGGDYKEIERRLLAAILMRFGLKPALAPDLAKAIKAADRDSAFFEATELAGFSVKRGAQVLRRASRCAKRFCGLSRTLAAGAGAGAISRPLRRARRLRGISCRACTSVRLP